MALSDDDVREILRIIDSSPLREIRVETDGFSLHVVKDGSEPDPEPAPRPKTALVTIEAPMLGMFYAADGPGGLRTRSPRRPRSPRKALARCAPCKRLAPRA